MLAHESEEFVGEREFFHSGDGAEDVGDVIGSLCGEERQGQAEAALAFHVDREEIRAGRHGDPELTSA